MTLKVGDLIGLTGDDEPALVVWRGHPGVVIDVVLGRDGTPWDVSVDLVAGPSLSGLPTFIEPITADEYRTRGERIIAGIHPIEDRPVGPHIMPVGEEWPVMPQ